ncbi:hypothetical protein BP5796_12349 [Coleophoma crateriformis]|uniref:Heterokaryon incompatibility domain-containing protein n=1 Tax=Coleophoma crateriformis TaxID=565419 RepID=A0A3D8Q9E3_9HELO|nr:hypothetical protein BP5796_12349 [Coleophoma crateriformis]
MIMGDIYKSARQVVVWLGEAADNSHLVFAHLKDDTRKSAFPNYPTPPAPQRRAWTALISRPWFFRTWVIQEVALNNLKATIICGEDSAPWMDLSSGSARDISGGADGLSSISSSPGNDPDHPLAGINVDCHVWRLRMLRAGSDPVDVLRYSRVCQSSEAKDRIYGILALFEPGFIPVDYHLPAEQIFGQFTEAIIQRMGDLHVLTCLGVGPHADSLPSWVPDFMNTKAVGTLPQHRWNPPYRPEGPVSCYTLRAADGTTQSSVASNDFPHKFLPGLAFPAGGALAVRGKLVDTIRTLGPVLPADTAWAPGTVAFFRVIRAWKSLAAALVPGWEKGKHPPPMFAHELPFITRAFAATLAASHRNELYSIDVGFTEWYRHCGTGVLEAEDPGMFLRKREFYLWWLSGARLDDDACGGEREAHGEGTRSGDAALLNELPTRSSSSSSSSSPPPPPPQPLSYELSRFAEQMEIACYGRCFFTTEGGSMGLAGPRARVGDRIAFIPGGDQPFVLRPRDGGTGWTMANDCYLYGLDPYALFEDDEHVVEEFVIF